MSLEPKMPQKSGQVSLSTDEHEIPAETLLQELRTHQIELEMQNIALRESEISLAESRDYYLEFYDFAPVGYITLSQDGRITEINLTGATLLGQDRGKILQQRFAAFVDPENSDFLHKYLISVLRNDSSQTCELCILRNDGVRFYVQLNSMRLVKKDKPSLVRMVLTDLSAQKRAAVALQERDIFVRTIVENIPGMLTYWSNDLRCQFSQNVNQNWFGFSPHEMQGIRLQDMLGEKLFRSGEPHIHAVLRGENQTFERSIVKHTGETRSLLVQYFAHKVSGKVQGFFVLATDISQLKQANEKLREASIAVDFKENVINQLKDYSNELNTTLKILVQQKQEYLQDDRIVLSDQIEQLVLPFLMMLKNDSHEAKKQELISIIEVNLKQLISSYGRPTTFAAASRKLSPKELQIASMVRQGLTSKDIAETLSLSIATVSNHRANIRKKIGLESKNSNLRSQLASMQK